MDSSLTTKGLSSEEAAQRLLRDGPNELPGRKSRSLLMIAISALREPMFQLLLGAGAIYFILGNFEEAITLLAFANVSIMIGIIQEARTEKTLEALRDLTSPRALVLRDGQQIRIPGRELVVGDIVFLTEGDRVPGDVVLLEAGDFAADESLLTGESVPVEKMAWDGQTPVILRPEVEGVPGAFSGSLVVRGHALGEVRAIGPQTSLGKIGKSLGGIEEEVTPLHRQTRRLVRVFATLGIAISVILAVILGLVRGDWIKAALSGITLAMATLPEEFPLVLSVFLALGAWRISRHRVLTRRSSAIEALGSATVLCTDKTGTLTQNRMEVAALAVDGLEWRSAEQSQVPAKLQGLLETAQLASRAGSADPMERALQALAARGTDSGQLPPPELVLVHEYPLRPELLAFGNLWETADGTALIAAAKGAPEAIADLCHLPAPEAARLQARVAALAATGLRVLAVAKATVRAEQYDATSQHDFAFEPVGLLGFADPLRPGVAAAVDACRQAGIRVAMITGDHPTTARAIAKQAGLGDNPPILSGVELEALAKDEAVRSIAATTIFARIMPEQKLRIVDALKGAGEIVAMTGDGVNDAPALKSAHIGIAMGQRGTDVAREAASLVLLDDDFGSIVVAVSLGRQIHDNLMKAMRFILAVHVPIVGLSLLPALFGWPAILAPIHVVFLELLIDPVCSIVFEGEVAERNVMRRPPRSASAPLLDIGHLVASAAQGAVALVAALAAYLIAGALGFDDDSRRTLTFVALIVGDIGLILANRELSGSILAGIGRSNVALRLVLVVTTIGLAVAIYLPPATHLFAFTPLSAVAIGVAVAIGLTSYPALEILGRVGQAVSARLDRRGVA